MDQAPAFKTSLKENSNCQEGSDCCPSSLWEKMAYIQEGGKSYKTIKFPTGESYLFEFLISVLVNVLSHVQKNYLATELKIEVSSPSSYKLLSSGKEHKKVFYGLILFWVLEKLTSKHLIGVDSFKASCAWKNAGLSGEKFVFLQNFMQQGQQLHYSCPPQRVMWMPMAPLSSSFFT